MKRCRGVGRDCALHSILASCALLVSSIPLPAWGAPSGAFTRTVALNDALEATAPPAGLFQDFIGAPQIDDSGNAVFVATRTTGGQSIWRETPGQLQLIARAGDFAPDTGATFGEFFDLAVAPSGAIAFKSLLRGNSVSSDNRESIWLARSGAVAIVARAGQRAPHPTADLHFAHFDTPLAINPAGQVVFFARTLEKEGSQRSGIWIAGNAGLQCVAVEGMPALASTTEVVFLPQGFEQPFANDPIVSTAGQTLFRGFLAGPGIDDSNLNGLWSHHGATGLELMQHAGDAAAGIPGGHFVSFPSPPTINAAGDSAFLAFYQIPPGINRLPDAMVAAHDPNGPLGLGLWTRGSSGKLRHVVSIGDAAPGVPGDVRIVDTFDPILNSSGRVAFFAVMAGDGIAPDHEIALWSNSLGSDEGLAMVARQGEAAPGSDAGFVFGSFLEPAMNARGQTAFMAAEYRLENGVLIDSGFGIWGQDRDGELRLVVREGEIIEVAAGDHREVASLMFASRSNGEDGRGSGFNDLGHVAFRATFTDGSSGIFISQALAVPEPLVGTLLAALVMLALHKRSRADAHNARVLR